MTVERMIFAIGGLFVLVSALLSVYVHPNWIWFTVFVGANMFQSAITGFCPMVPILKKIFGLQTGAAYK